jgi:6-phosphofructokinase 2
MATDEGVVYAPPLAINVLSAVGAGDSFVGGMVWSLSRGEDLRQAFAYGVAAGSAALLNKGTGLAYPEDVHQLVQNVLQTGDLALVDL